MSGIELSMVKRIRPRNSADLKALAEQLGRPLYSLYAMASGSDPFLAGSPARLRNAEWFAKIWNDLGARRGFHLRRLHYLVVSQRPPVLLPDGTPYTNTLESARTLYDGSRDARHLGLVDADDLVDRRNPAPKLYRQEGADGDIGVGGGLELITPTLDIPRLFVTAPTIAQPFQVEIWCEKSTMNDILEPLCDRYGLKGLAVQKLNAGAAAIRPLAFQGALGRTDAPLRGGRTGLSNARVDAARNAQHGAAMIAEGLKVVCVQRVDEGLSSKAPSGVLLAAPRPPRDFGNSVDHEKSVRPFKGIFCRDISEFESYMPSHAVRSPSAKMRVVPTLPIHWRVVECLGEHQLAC